MKIGAFDYGQKPFEIEEMELKVEKAIEHRRLKHEIEYLRHTQQDIYEFDRIVGASGALQSVLSIVKKVAKSNTTVLVRGETGTGKELIAGAIHHNSHRAARNFIKVNCAALQENLLESELFGHEKGAFTGADKQRVGRFEQADGGTLFLDEVGDMSANTQAKILRVLQEHEFERLGGTRTLRTDVRVIARLQHGRQDSADRHRARGDRAPGADRGAEDVELGPEGRRGAALDQPARDELQDQDAGDRVSARPQDRRSRLRRSGSAG